MGTKQVVFDETISPVKMKVCDNVYLSIDDSLNMDTKATNEPETEANIRNVMKNWRYRTIC